MRIVNHKCRRRGGDQQPREGEKPPEEKGKSFSSIPRDSMFCGGA